MMAAEESLVLPLLVKGVIANLIPWLILWVFVRDYGRAVARLYHARYFALEPAPRMARGSAWALVLLAAVLGLMRGKVPGLAMPFLALILGALFAAKYVDGIWQVIPDRFHVWGALGMAGFLTVLARMPGRGFDVSEALVGLALTMALFGLTWAYQRIRRREGLGLGDVKLILWLSPALGSGVVGLLLVSCLLALIWLTPRLLLRRATLAAPFAFGPFIYYAFLICFVAKWAS